MAHFADPEKQLSIIRRGTAEIIPESGLLAKLKDSAEKNRPLKIKAGFDPTAPDIHLGHTVLIQKLKVFQDLGHTIYFLVGDFTGRIGDPTGKSETRPSLTKEDVRINAETYKSQVFKILDPEKTKVVYNSEWLGSMTPEMIVELSAKYTVARMLERDDFAKRYAEQRPISIHEFLYPLFQGYDSVAIKADVELGGSDQKFNLLVGRDLQRAYGQQPQAIVTLPLLEGTDGEMKMSKSYNNYIGIDEPAKEIFGKILSVSDSLMLRYYELLSDIDNDQFEALKSGMADGSMHPKKVKVDLAKEIVTRFHSRDMADQAETEFENIFKKKDLPNKIENHKIDWENEGESWLPQALKNAGLIKSTSEGMRLIKQGAVSIENVKVADPDFHLTQGNEKIVKVGKKRFVRFS